MRRLLLPLLVLLALGLLITRDESPQLGGPVRVTPRAPAESHSPRPDAPPAAKPKAALPVTKFLARLRLGDTLWAMFEGGRADSAEEVAEFLRKNRAGILECDVAQQENVWIRLKGLCTPRRDRASLRLVNADEGREEEALALRLWTRGEDYPAEAIVRAERLLDHLEALVGLRARGGIDVLATPEMGRELFPGARQWPPPGEAIGLYLPADGFCLVDSTFGGRAGGAVLRHEVIHALLARTAPLFGHLPFLTEGLAEYLREAAPSDEGLRVPPQRFADEFAAIRFFIDYFEEQGFDFGSIRLDRLLQLDRPRFYALPWALSYELSLAAIACVAPEPVEEALRSRRAAPLEHAISNLGWKRLMTFVGEAALRGRAHRAHIVRHGKEDEGYTEQELDRIRLGVLHYLGVRLPDRELNLGELEGGQIGSRARLAQVAQALRAAPGGIVLATDLSSAMDVTFAAPLRLDLLDRPNDSVPEAWTPREVVATILRRLAPSLIVGLAAEEPALFDLRAQLPYDARGLPARLAAAGQHEPLLILCCASRQERPEAETGARIGEVRDRLARAGIRPTAVLVLDFAPSGGEGRLLAAAFAPERVAYWTP